MNNNRFRSSNSRVERSSRERPRNRDSAARGHYSRDNSHGNNRHSRRQRSRSRGRGASYESFEEHKLHFSPPQHEGNEERFYRHDSPEPEYIPLFEPPQRDESEEEHRRQWEYENRNDILNHSVLSYDNRNQAGPSYEIIHNPAPQQTWSNMQPEERSSFSDPTIFMKDNGHPRLPVFDGENPNLTSRKFIKMLEQVAQEENWTMEEKKMQLGAKLGGAAREWFLKEDRLTDTYRTFKRAFLLAFLSEMDYFNSLQRMMQRNKLPAESYSNYFAFKTVLLNNCQITGRKAVSCIIGGLINEELKMKCYDMNFDTAENLYNYIMQQEEQVQVINLVDPPNPNVMPNVKLCYYCSEAGHMAHQCPKKLNVHDDNSFTDVGVNGMMFRAYNDKRSEICSIRHDQSTVAKLLYNRKKTTVRGYNGNLISTIGEGNILLTIDNVVVSVQIYVVPNAVQDIPVVIGNSLRQHELLMYFEDQEGFHFKEKRYKPGENSSFHMNEMLVKKFSGNQGNKQFFGNSNIQNKKKKW